MVALLFLAALLLPCESVSLNLQKPQSGKDNAKFNARLRAFQLLNFPSFRTVKVWKPEDGVIFLQPYPGKPWLFMHERGDGVGGRMTTVFMTMAYANEMQINFGGCIFNPESHPSPHHVNVEAMRVFMFGEKGHKEVFLPFKVFTDIDVYYPKGWKPSNILGPSKQPTPGADGGNLLEDFKAGELTGVKRIAVESSYFESQMRGSPRRQRDKTIDDTDWMSEQFLKKLWNGFKDAEIYKHPLRFKSGRPSVAVHLRRGDCLPGCWRITPDGWYYNHVEKIRKIHPDADVHVFTNIETIYDQENQPKKGWKLADFQGYADRNMTLHINESEQDAWAHLARADVALLSKSSFAYAPALMNKKCVVFDSYLYPTPQFWHDGSTQPGFIQFAGERTPRGTEEQFRKCLGRIHGS